VTVVRADRTRYSSSKTGYGDVNTTLFKYLFTYVIATCFDLGPSSGKIIG
jgi:hypothetical protein